MEKQKLNSHIKKTLLALLCLGILIFVDKALITSKTAKIPMSFNLGKTPLIKVKIEGKYQYMKIDLGSKFPLLISKTNLAKISKSAYQAYTYHDVFGNCYTAQGYIIPSLEIDAFKLKDILAVEKLEDYHAKTRLWHDEKVCKEFKGPIYFGLIGRPLLEKFNLYFDFLNSYMVICKKKNGLKTRGINLDNFTQIAFEASKFGIVLNIETDLGLKKFILDTGASISCFQEAELKHVNIQEDPDYDKLPYYLTEKFIIGRADFGKTYLYSLKVSSDLKEIKGILGMDFLNKHRIYIDNQKKVLYISR